MGADSCALFSDLGILPYDYLIAQESVVADRIGLLQKIGSWQKGVVIVALPTLASSLATSRLFIKQSAFGAYRW